jgi:hypothetical protein
MNKLRITAVFLCVTYLLAGASLPSPIRQDEAFWRRLTSAAQNVLMNTPVLVRSTCRGVHGRFFVGGVYHSKTNTIELCGIDSREDSSRLRHDALHALDWAGGQMASETSGFLKVVPAHLRQRAERLYKGWLRSGELWAILPIVVDWQWDQLPPDVAAFYAPWFTDAR